MHKLMGDLMQTMFNSRLLAYLALIASTLLFFNGCASTTTAGGSQSASDENGGFEFDTRGNEDANSSAYNAGREFSGQNINTPGADSNGRVIYFDFDSDVIRSEARPIIESHAEYLLANPAAAVLLEGHTDELGTREYNIGLGERRGNAVRRVFLAFGVDSQQIEVVSYGEERPAAAGQDEFAYAENRRVEIAY